MRFSTSFFFHCTYYQNTRKNFLIKARAKEVIIIFGSQVQLHRGMYLPLPVIPAYRLEEIHTGPFLSQLSIGCTEILGCPFLSYLAKHRLDIYIPASSCPTSNICTCPFLSYLPIGWTEIRTCPFLSYCWIFLNVEQLNVERQRVDRQPNINRLNVELLNVENTQRRIRPVPMSNMTQRRKTQRRNYSMFNATTQCRKTKRWIWIY